MRRCITILTFKNGDEERLLAMTRIWKLTRTRKMFHVASMTTPSLSGRPSSSFGISNWRQKEQKISMHITKTLNNSMRSEGDVKRWNHLDVSILCVHCNCERFSCATYFLFISKVGLLVKVVEFSIQQTHTWLQIFIYCNPLLFR